MEGSDKAVVGSKAVRAAAWGYAGSLAKVLIQLVAQAVLARILGPGEYGIFAIGLVVVSLSIFFADSGAGAALIQRATNEPEIISFAFGIQLLLGVTVTALIWLLAGPIAEFYREPRAEIIIRVLGVVVFITAASSVSASLLKRQLDFKTLQFGQVAGFFTGYILVGIPVALAGGGVWSLVFAWLVQALVTAAWWYRKVTHPLRPRFSSPGGKGLLNFGGATIVSNLSTWASSNVDKIVVGRVMSSASLGLYTVPFTLLGTVAAQILATLQPVLFSASSRFANDIGALRRSYLSVLEGVALLLLPVFATVAVIPEVVLNGIYGPRWIDAASIMQAASVGMAFYTLGALGTPILWAMNRVKKEAVPQMFATLILLIVSIYLAQFSASNVAWGVAAVSLGRTIWVLRLVCQALDMNWKDALRALLPAAIAACMCAMAATALANSLTVFDIQAVLVLGLVVICSALVLALTVLMMKGRILSPDLDSRVGSLIRRVYSR